MSALPPKADIAECDYHVRFVPKADIGPKRKSEPARGRYNLRWIKLTPGLNLLSYCGRGRRTGVRSLEAMMKLLRTTALTAVLMTAAVPSLTSSAHAWDWAWRGGGWGWGGVSVGEAAGALIGVPVSSYACGYPPAYGYGFGYPAYCYGYGTGYSYPAYGGYRHAYRPYVRRHLYGRAYGVRHIYSR